MKKRSKHLNNSYFRQAMDSLRKHPLAMAGMVILIVEIIAVVFLPLLLHLDPYTSDPLYFDSAPAKSHILGTDQIGRDLFARLLYGGRTSLLVGVFSTLIALAIGVPLGLVAGYYGGAAEMIIMRICDIFMSFPSIVLILVLVSILGPSVWSVTFTIGVLDWTEFTRLIYANVLSVKEQEYVESARAIGTPGFSTMVRYILPNAFPPILIAVTFHVASAILSESALSFLGMGVQPPQASWGNLLHDAQSITILSREPWVWLPPGLAIVLTVLSINFFGDGVRDALDPRMQAR